MENVRTFLPLVSIGGGIALGYYLYDQGLEGILGCQTDPVNPVNPSGPTCDPNMPNSIQCQKQACSAKGPDWTWDEQLMVCSQHGGGHRPNCPDGSNNCSSPINPPPLIPINHDYVECDAKFSDLQEAMMAYLSGDRSKDIGTIQTMITNYLAEPCPHTLHYNDNYIWIDKTMKQILSIPTVLPINAPTTDPSLLQLQKQIALWGQCGANYFNHRSFLANYKQITEGWQTLFRLGHISSDVYAQGVTDLGNVMHGC